MCVIRTTRAMSNLPHPSPAATSINDYYYYNHWVHLPQQSCLLEAYDYFMTRPKSKEVLSFTTTYGAVVQSLQVWCALWYWLLLYVEGYKIVVDLVL